MGLFLKPAMLFAEIQSLVSGLGGAQVGQEMSDQRLVLFVALEIIPGSLVHGLERGSWLAQAFLQVIMDVDSTLLLAGREALATQEAREEKEVRILYQAQVLALEHQAESTSQPALENGNIDLRVTRDTQDLRSLPNFPEQYEVWTKKLTSLKLREAYI